MTIKSATVKLDGLLRLFISAILIFSVFGKLINTSVSISNLGQLFGIPSTIAITVTISWSLLEVILTVLIWQTRVSQVTLVVPVALLAVTFLSRWRDLDCGCFGSLPYLSQLSFGGHLLLLGGMFLGLYYLTVSPKAEKVTENSQSFRASYWTGFAGIGMMLSAFLTLPFTSSDSRTFNHLSHDTVDRSAVETAIANHSAIIIDARPGFQYELGYLPGAINIPYDSDNLVELVNTHSLKNQPLIIYCSSAHCNAAELLAEKLRELGCKKISIYPGGWEDWERG